MTIISGEGGDRFLDGTRTFLRVLLPFKLFRLRGCDLSSHTLKTSAKAKYFVFFCADEKVELNNNPFSSFHPFSIWRLWGGGVFMPGCWRERQEVRSVM